MELVIATWAGFTGGLIAATLVYIFFLRKIEVTGVQMNVPITQKAKQTKNNQNDVILRSDEVIAEEEYRQIVNKRQA